MYPSRARHGTRLEAGSGGTLFDEPGHTHVGGGALPGGVRRDVRGEPEAMHVADESVGIAALVPAHGAPPGGLGSRLSISTTVARSAYRSAVVSWRQL